MPTVKPLDVVIEAALVIVAILVLALPEARTTPMRAFLTCLYVFVAGRTLWRYQKIGIYKMTPAQLYATASDRPRGTLLNFAASMLGFVALIVSTL